jgi:hypothetical protein
MLQYLDCSPYGVRCNEDALKAAQVALSDNGLELASLDTDIIKQKATLREVEDDIKTLGPIMESLRAATYYLATNEDFACKTGDIIKDVSRVFAGCKK